MYVCAIECSDNIVVLGDTHRIITDVSAEAPQRIVALYNVQHNHSYRSHLPFLSKDLVTRVMVDAVEQRIADRYYYDRRGSEWYKVRAGTKKQRRWMEDVTDGYKQHPTGGYYASHRVSHLKASEVDDRPVCDHGYPCEVHYGKEEVYFDCAAKYVWPDFLPHVARVTPCAFRQIAYFPSDAQGDGGR